LLQQRQEWGEAENPYKRVSILIKPKFLLFFELKNNNIMKKSSIFLGVSAFFLAIAGAFATKAKTVDVQYFYNDGAFESIPNPGCVPGQNLCRYTTAGTTSFTVIYLTTGLQHYATAKKD
jgi:hypothetical protein